MYFRSTPNLFVSDIATISPIFLILPGLDGSLIMKHILLEKLQEFRRVVFQHLSQMSSLAK
jgi:hypothetical protein